jgi:hypothetical protein
VTVEPFDISQDPGRPEGVVDGAPGAMLIIISGPSGVSWAYMLARCRSSIWSAG